MSFDKSITFICSCDDCSDETLDTEEEDFQMAVEAAKKAGWKISKRKGEWHHQCPACQETEREDDFDVI